MKKMIKSLIAAIGVALTMTGSTFAAEAVTIGDVEALKAFAVAVNGGTSYEGYTVALSADLDLTGVEWTPIGVGTRSSKSYTGKAFKGTFDGGNHTISGLTITSTDSDDAAVGLFGVVDGGTVKNLKLDAVNINVASSDLAGGAIGLMVNNAKAENITVGGSIVGYDGVGGIAGRMIISGTISSCTNNASVTSSYGGIGGIVGKAYYEDGANTALFASVDKCVNNGTITAPMYVGGITGLARANVVGCINNGVVVGGTQTGGIVGQLIAAGTVSNNENNAKISGKNHLGGIIGDYSQSNAYTYYNVTIADNINRGELAATEQRAAILGCNNIDGFTAMTASGNVSFYNAEGLELFGNPEDMVIDSTNIFNPAMTLSDFVQKVVAGNGVFDGNGATVPVSGDARTETKEGLPDRLQKYTNPEVYYAQYQRFGNLTDVSISNVKFVFVPAPVTVVDAWNTAGATTTADNINGELQLLNAGNVTFINCSFEKISVSPINATAVSVSGCSFNGLDAYAIKDIKASTVTVADTTFTDCNGGFWMNAAPAVLSVTGNTFANVGRRGAIQFSANGDYSSAEMTVTDNTVTGGAFLWQLNPTVTYEQVSAILDTTENTYGTAYVSGSVEPKPPVAKIGDVTYATFAEALTAAKAMTGDVTVEIYEKVTLNTSLSGNYSSITFVGKDTDAEIYLDVQGYITATGKTVNFQDLTLSKSQGGFITNAGFMNTAFGVYDVKAVNYTNCTFSNGAYASSGTVTFTKCIFKRSWDKYGLWAYGDVNCIVDECTFDDYRGIKMYAEGAAKTTELTVKKSNFSAVTDKPAIVLTYGESVNLEGNTYSSTGTFELDLDGAPNGVAVTSDVTPTCKNDNGACGVLVDGKIYTTVAQAAAVATSGSKVTLLHDSTETVEFAEGVTLNKNGFTADGVTVAQPVAKIGETTYATLEAAFAAATEGQTITLLSDVAWTKDYGTGAPTIASVIDLGDKTLTIADGNIRFSTITLKNGNIVIDPAGSYSGNGVFYMFDEKVLTLDNVKLTAENFNGYSIFCMEGNSDLVLQNGTEITVKNANIYGIVAAVSEGEVTIDNAKITGETITGRGFLNGNYTIKGTSEITLTGVTKDGFYIGAGDTLNIQDTAKVAITLNADGDNRYGINISTATSTYTKADTATVTATLYAPAVAKIGDTPYITLAAAAEAAQAGDEIVLLADVAEDVVVPAGVIFNGNGKQVGVITAAGTITFKGVTKATNFGVQYVGTTINIGEGACLEITGTGRLVVGHGCTFNITGTVADAKTVDKATLTPSLIVAAGASFTGKDLTFNVKNAYVKFNGNSTSKNKSANGTFNFNIENSIWEQTGVLAFYVPTEGMDPTFNLNLKDSVLTTTSHLVFSVTKGEIVFDNSNVNVGKSNQIENRSTMTVKNGSVVNGAVATSSNAINPGTIIVENATYAVTGQFSGATEGTGTLIIKQGANVSVGSIVDKANIQIDATGMTADEVINFTANLSKFTGTVEVVNNDKLEASVVDGKIVLALKPVAKIGDTPYATLEDAFKAATSGCTIEILDNVTIDYKWDCRDYATGGSHSQFKESVTINGNGHTLKFTGTVNDSNWNTIFRFEENATVNNLTVDISEATGAQRVISAKKSLTVNGLTIVGSAKYGIIFGEGASADDLAESEIVVTNSSLTGTRRAISDNENGKDVKSVVITGTTLKANVNVSACDLVTFSNNTVEGGYVDIRSYTADAKLDVTAIGNTLTANTEAKYNYVKASGTLNVQSEFVLPPYGTLTNCYTSATGYWGECGGNAKESFVFKFYNDDTYMGYTSLNNVGGIIDGDVNVSWNIKLDAASNTDEYWTMAWEVQPTLAMQPNRCEQWVDGVKVAECAVEPNWSDRIFPVVAAVTDEKGQILSYVNNHESATMANAVANGGYVTLLADVKIDASLDLPADKTLTLNLNGKKVSGSAVLNNAGDLTVRDSSAEKDATNELAIVNTGKLAISSGHFAGAISGEGEFAITGGTYVQNVADYCAEGYLCAEQNCVPVLWKVGRLPSAEVINLGPVEVGPEGDFTFGDNYYVYDLVGTQKMTTSTEPFDLQIALNFIAKDTVAQAEKNAFGNYTTDFYITIDDIADGSFVADEDCYLAGYYPSFNAWVKIPLTGFEIVDGKVYPVITSAGFDFKYTDICGSVGDFICGIHLSDAVLQANPALKVKLELGLSKTYNEALAADKFIGVDQPYEYDVEDMTSAVAVTGPDYYTTVTGAVEVAVQTGDFVKLVTDANLDDNLAVESNLVINLGGNTLAADGKTLTIADSVVTITNGTLSAFTKDNVTLSGNAILTVTDKVVADSFRTEANYYVSQNANGTHSIMLKSAFRVFITMVDGEPRIGFFKDCDTERAPTAYAIKGATNLETPEWADVDYETATDAAAASELPLHWVKPTEGSEFRFFKLLAE